MTQLQVLTRPPVTTGLQILYTSSSKWMLHASMIGSIKQHESFRRISFHSYNSHKFFVETTPNQARLSLEFSNGISTFDKKEHLMDIGSVFKSIYAILNYKSHTYTVSKLSYSIFIGWCGIAQLILSFLSGSRGCDCHNHPHISRLQWALVLQWDCDIMQKMVIL